MVEVDATRIVKTVSEILQDHVARVSLAEARLGTIAESAGAVGLAKLAASLDQVRKNLKSSVKTLQRDLLRASEG
jgi:hypothetical protein